MSNLINSINQIISENDLPIHWSKKINNELNNINSSSKLERKDLTKKPFITIDGEDAKDIDDAVYCIKKSSNFILLCFFGLTCLKVNIGLTNSIG